MTKVVEWFGFKLHLLVDVRHEVVLSYEITDTKAGDGETLPSVLGQAEANLPAGRIETLAYDMAADGEAVHAMLSGKGITPLIRMRGLWQGDPERPLPGHDGTSNVVYTEDGTIYCYDKVSDPPARHKMSYIGHEPERETLKYRCPAKHEGWECPMSAECNAGKSYGKTVRVPREVDPRRFPALPRATKKFERMYKGRTAVERVNARLKVFWGVDDGNVRDRGGSSRRWVWCWRCTRCSRRCWLRRRGARGRWGRSGSARSPRRCATGRKREPRSWRSDGRGDRARRGRRRRSRCAPSGRRGVARPRRWSIGAVRTWKDRLRPRCNDGRPRNSQQHHRLLHVGGSPGPP